MAENIHATCIVIGERGVLIRGASGAGKSALARDLIAHFQRSGFARLVADDRVLVTHADGRLIATPHAATAGQMEQRGLGIIASAHEPACVIALVVDLAGPGDEQAQRMPPADQAALVAGTMLPHLIARDGREALPLVAAWLSGARAQHSSAER